MTTESNKSTAYLLTESALADATKTLADATRLRLSADTAHAAALATKGEAEAAHASMARRVAGGEPVTPADTAEASSAVRDALAHVSLMASALSIATATESAATDELARAAFNHAQHVVKEKHRARGDACRHLDAAAKAFELSLINWQTAGNDLIEADHKAEAARASRLGPGWLRQSGGASFDRSKVDAARGAAALPAWILNALRSPLTSESMAEQARIADRDGGL